MFHWWPWKKDVFNGECFPVPVTIMFRCFHKALYSKKWSTVVAHDGKMLRLHPCLSRCWQHQCVATFLIFNIKSQHGLRVLEEQPIDILYEVSCQKRCREIQKIRLTFKVRNTDTGTLFKRIGILLLWINIEGRGSTTKQIEWRWNASLSMISSFNKSDDDSHSDESYDDEKGIKG